MKPRSDKPVRVIAVTGGKGGVGKTNVSANLSLAMSQRNQRVVLLDADLGLANVDVLLGLKPQHNIADLLNGQCTLRDIMLEVTPNFHIVPAASGTQEMTALDAHEHAELIYAFNEVSDDIDVLIIDTAAGISSGVISFVRAAQETLLVVCDEPTSITDAYALIKLLNRDYQMDRFRVLANMVRSEQEGRNMFNKLSTVTDRFMDVSLQYQGSIPYDEAVRSAVRQQTCVVNAFPDTKASVAFRQLAVKVERWPMATSPKGHLEFFVERLLGSY